VSAPLLLDDVLVDLDVRLVRLPVGLMVGLACRQMEMERWIWRRVDVHLQRLQHPPAMG
jgi:hypothetical protein